MCRLALTLQDNATVEDLGTGVELRVACSVISGVSRFVRSKGLQRVVITTSLQELIPWAGADAVVFMGSTPADCRVCVNPILKAALRRPAIRLRYDLTQRDSGRLPPAVEYAVVSAQAPDRPPRVALTSRVLLDDNTAHASRVFDMKFKGESTVLLSAAPMVPPADTWSLGLLHGVSGCGKTTHLHSIAGSWIEAAPPGQRRAVSVVPPAASWPSELSVQSVLDALVASLMTTTSGGCELLTAVGLREDAWQLPFQILSSGERELVSLAYALSPAVAAPSEGDGTVPLTLIVVDEFTPALDACAAHATAARVAAFVRKRPHLRLLAAAVRDNVPEWLRADWSYDVPAGRMVLLAAPYAAAAPPPPPPPPPPPAVGDAAAVTALFTPPTVRIVVRSCKPGIKLNDRQHETRGPAALLAQLFAQLHYLTSNIATACTAYIARLDDDSGGLFGEPIGFVAVAPLPGILTDGRLKLREARLVVSPCFQGLGVGPQLSLLVAAHVSVHGNGSRDDSVAGYQAVAARGARASKPAKFPPYRYSAITALESLQGSRDRDDSNWRRQDSYGKTGKVRAGLTESLAW